MLKGTVWWVLLELKINEIGGSAGLSSDNLKN